MTCIKNGLQLCINIALQFTLYQVMEKTRAKKVIVEQRLSGKVVIKYKGKELASKEIRIEQYKMAKNNSKMQMAANY